MNCSKRSGLWATAWISMIIANSVLAAEIYVSSQSGDDESGATTRR